MHKTNCMQSIEQISTGKHLVAYVLKMSLKHRQNEGIKTNSNLIMVEIIAECSLGAFCNTFDLHYYKR